MTEAALREKAEAGIAATAGAAHALLVGRGCTALWLWLRVMDFAGRGVVVPANICPVVPYTIVLSGNHPVFVDTDASGLADLAALARLPASCAAAALGVHTYGHVLDWTRFAAVCQEKGWEMFEDAAAALGARHGDAPVGGLAGAGVLSFGPGKQLDLPGGGALTCRDARLRREAARLFARFEPLSLDAIMARARGFTERFWHGNGLESGAFSLDDLAWTLLCGIEAPADYLDALNRGIGSLAQDTAQRQAKAEALRRGLDHPDVRHQPAPQGSAYWRYNILAGRDRDRLLAHLRREGIKASAYFGPCHRLFAATRELDFPASEREGSRIVNLWVGPQTSLAETGRIAREIVRFFDEIPAGEATE